MLRIKPVAIVRFSSTILATMLLVGLALSVSAASDSSSSQTEGSITLADSGCTITVRSGDLDFGAWNWDGTSYQSESGDASSAVLYQVTGPRDGGCRITIQTAGLSHEQEGSSALIGPEYLAVEMVLVPRSDSHTVYFGNDGTVTVPWERQLNPLGVSISLMSVPNDVPPGKYEGEFEFTISAGP